MIHDKFNQIIGYATSDLYEQFKETVSEAYDLGFKNGSESIKRYAVNVLKFDEDLVKDIIKQFTTLEDAQTYIKRVTANNYCAYLYEYDYVNDQYESIEV